MVYVALLRGINVGGNNKIEMSKLKVGFESLGCKSVLSYINSGNVVFADDRTSKELVPLVEGLIKRDFGLNIRVVLRDYKNIDMLCAKISTDWTNDSNQRTDVLFLWDEIDNPEVLKKVIINPKIENLNYLPGALVWNIARKNVTRGSIIKLVKSDVYKKMTIRNINTVRKLQGLMEKVTE